MTDPAKPEPPKTPQKREDWIERLARQSSGVGQPEKPEPESSAEADQKEARRLWKLAGTGLQMAATTGLFWFAGREMDVYFGWHGGASIWMTSLAIVGSLYLVIKEAWKANK